MSNQLQKWQAMGYYKQGWAEGGSNPMMDNISCKGGDNTPISFILVVIHGSCVTSAEGLEFLFVSVSK